MKIQPAAQSHPHIAELELEAYGRDWILEAFISMPLIIFIDGFGVYRNMYCSLIGIYTIAAQSLQDRMKRSNVFVITLGPHGAKLNDVMSSLPELSKLDRGTILTINGKMKRVLAFPICFTGDMPQQNDNAGVLRLGCALLAQYSAHSLSGLLSWVSS
ncbi:hypothetical protein VC83_00622 [Pseudogymnoascus destructans]|uniref:Uncharacterized protein n=1 Tax=Pseudogymnoascus destructans TaxID=655981 RepID=A0A177ANU0_9PEZI|nr:uncharacterized protein VC83_00622 [Pseudogymnoascus destructans]OAF62844.1 hypothetical protein VC83_00622 [Pseudogymnoascus destructans]